MSDMEIVVEFDDESLLYHSRRGAEVGFTIFFRHRGIAYPCVGWDDFGARLLSFWMYQLAEIRSSSKDDLELIFLDGDFSLVGEFDRNTNCLTLRPTVADESFEWSISIDSMIAAVKESARAVVERFEKLSVRPRDVAALKIGIRHFS